MIIRDDAYFCICSSTLPVWEDHIIFNENFKYFVHSERKVLLIFEVSGTFDICTWNIGGRNGIASLIHHSFSDCLIVLWRIACFCAYFASVQAVLSHIVTPMNKYQLFIMW